MYLPVYICIMNLIKGMKEIKNSFGQSNNLFFLFFYIYIIKEK